MPLPGDQHRENGATTNPFLVQTPHVTEYTAQEIATLASRLEKQLGPEYISTRPGNGGGKVHYLAAEKVINLANEVFGFNGWSSAIQNVQIDFVDENPENGKINLGLSTIVRVTLRDGTFHEDIGYGHCENTKGKAAAFEKAKKEAATDGLKRALRTFGNVLGNCLYDKDYLQKVTKVKVAPSRWDAENLHRHPDYAPIKKEQVAVDTAQQAKGPVVPRNTSLQSAHSAISSGSAEFEDEFGALDDTDFGNPDEVRLDDTTNNGGASPTTHGMPSYHRTGQLQNPTRAMTMPQMRPTSNQQLPLQNMQPPQRAQTMQRPAGNAGHPPPRMLPPQNPANTHRPPMGQNGQLQTRSDGSGPNSLLSTASDLSSNQAQQTAATKGALADAQALIQPREVPQGVPDGFVTSRNADVINHPSDAKLPDTSLAFNPHAESPSIRRTQGINPGKSVPISRHQITGMSAGGPPDQPLLPAPAISGFSPAVSNASNPALRPAGPNFVNPAADMNRRIGMPQNSMGRQSPNAAPYRAPTATKRSAMVDVTNIQQLDGGSDSKKAKLDPAPMQGGNVAAKDIAAAV